MNQHTPVGQASTIKIAAAFLAVYLIWGSTYLAIAFVVESLPPFLMAGARFLVAGSMMYAWARMKGAAAPTRSHWIATAIIGGLLLCGGNGGVVWAEKHVPSGLTALLVATVPLWVVVLEWIGPARLRPTRMVVFGVLLGLAGVGILAGPSQFAGAKRVDPIGTVVLLFATLSWSIGSIYSRRVKLPSSSLLATAMEMLAGGVLLTVLGSLHGDWGDIHARNFTLKSVLSLGYLIAFGSLIGFTAYTWLLKVSTPSRVATYAYVNPVVAVILGWLLAGEPMNARTLIAAGVIVTGVVFITQGAKRPNRKDPMPDEPVKASMPLALKPPEPERELAGC